MDSSGTEFPAGHGVRLHTHLAAAERDPVAPYGVRGVGEPPTISTTPTVPVRPEHIALPAAGPINA
jgi:hypothetical protein